MHKSKLPDSAAYVRRGKISLGGLSTLDMVSVLRGLYVRRIQARNGLIYMPPVLMGKVNQRGSGTFGKLSIAPAMWFHKKESLPPKSISCYLR